MGTQLTQQPRLDRNQTLTALDACMNIGDGLLGILESTSGAILAQRGGRQPTLEQSIMTGCQPEFRF